MKFFVAAIIFAFADDVISNCVSVGGTDYEDTILKGDIANPYHLTIDHNTNTLFYSYTAPEALYLFESAYLNLNTGAFGTIYGIKGGFAHAVNTNNHIVFMGGEDGLYKFNYKTMNATRFHLKEKLNIFQMFYKDGLYFTTFPEEKVYFIKKNQFVKLHALEHVNVTLIAVNTVNDLIFFNATGVFMYERANGTTVFLSDIVANGVTSDRYGNIVFSALDGIYYLNIALKQVQHVANMANIYGVVVENNGNIIYAAEKSIHRLKPGTISCKPKM